MTLDFLVQVVCVISLVQSVVQMNTWISVSLHPINVQALDVHHCSRGCPSPKVDQHFLRLTSIDLKVVKLTPFDKVHDVLPVLQLVLL